MNPAIKHAPIDKWSTREKLSLASSVLTAGDQNWYSVSRQCKPFGESNRPGDWFSQKNCALQYSELLDNVETPKRKRGEKNEDTMQNLIVRKLTMERINELKDRIENDNKELDHFKKNISLLKNDNLSETDLKIIENQMLEALKQAKKDEEDHEIWLKERADKYAAFSRKKSIGLLKTPRKDDSLSGSVPSTPTKTPTTNASLHSLVSSQDQDSQSVESNKNQSTIDDKHKVLKLEDILTFNQEDVAKTKDKQSKDEALNIIVINEDSKGQSNDLIDEDKPVKDASDKNKVEITLVHSRTLAENMEIDNSETASAQRSAKSTTKETIDKSLQEIKEEKQEQNKEQSESIASNKRKRTSTSISLSTPTSVVTTPTTTANVQPSTPSQQTRRSGRIKPTTRTSTQNTPSVTLTPKLETSTVEQQQTPQPQQQQQQQKKQIIDEQNTAQQSTIITNQALLNDESTKDSTTSDLTDTYTSPNSPASSILNIDHSDPEKAKEQKEYKAWKKAITVLWCQASKHRYSPLFISPVKDEEAPGYSEVVKKPIDLTTIRNKIDSGEIRTTQDFQRDIMLMFQNAIMYNSASHDAHKEAVEMQKEMLESIEEFLQHQKDEKNASTSQKDSSSTSSRRKSRTT